MGAAKYRDEMFALEKVLKENSVDVKLVRYSETKADACPAEVKQRRGMRWRK